MSEIVALSERSWKRSRYGFVGFYFLTLLIGWLGLRVVFLCLFSPTGHSPGEIARTFANGFQRDVFFALLEALPLLGWLAIIPNRQFSARWHRVFFWCASFL